MIRHVNKFFVLRDGLESSIDHKISSLGLLDEISLTQREQLTEKQE